MEIKKNTLITYNFFPFKDINFKDVYKNNDLNFKEINEKFKKNNKKFELEVRKKLEKKMSKVIIWDFSINSKKLDKCLELSFLEMVRDSKKNRNTIAIVIKKMKEGEYLQVTTSKTLEIMEKIKHSFTQIVELSLKIHLVSIEDNRILRN